MSGGYSAIRWLQVALQSGTTDTPGAFTYVDVQGDFNPNTDQGKVPVEVERDDGEITKPAMGAKSGGFPLTGLVRGKGAGAGNSTAAVGGEFDALLDALCGAAGAHGTGLTSGADHDTDTIKLADTSGHPIGNGLLIDSDPTSGVRFEAREVIAISSNVSADLDRVLQGTPANSAVAYASTSWYIDADDSAHSHVYCKAEGEDWRRDVAWRSGNGRSSPMIGRMRPRRIPRIQRPPASARCLCSARPSSSRQSRPSSSSAR